MKKRRRAAPRTQANKESSSAARSRFDVWVVLALIAVNVVVFANLRKSDFINFDDPQYVSENPDISSGLTAQAVHWAFTTGRASNWHPLTWLSHMIDIQLWGLNAGAHHLTNLFFHILNTILLFALLKRMTGALGQSAFVAALFAVHPMHVESVAWISERKDVLSTLFWILTMWAYVTYVRNPQPARYALVLILFALGLMSKPMLVTLPFVLLLLDYWPLKRIEFGDWSRAFRLMLEKLPLVGLAAASSIITVLVQQRALSGLDALSWRLRLSNAAVSYIDYIGKMLWPTRLAAFYPFNKSLPLLWVAASLLTLAALTVMAIIVARRRPYITIGWLWYLGTLVPVIGLVQVGGQAIADRYTYVPYIGLFIIVAWGLPDLFEKFQYRTTALTVAAGLTLALCTLTAHAQVQYWKNSETLWTHAVEVNDRNVFAHTLLGSLLVARGAIDEGEAHFLAALRSEPDSAVAHNKLAAALDEQGNLGDAVNHYNAALRADPNMVEARTNVANALVRQGKATEAAAQYLEAIRIQPNYAEAHNGLGSLLSDQGKIAEAIGHYREALRLKPDFADARNNLAAALAGQGNIDGAIHEFSEAIKIKPDSADFHYNLGVMLKTKGDVRGAAAEFQAALKLNPAHASARLGLNEVAGGSQQ
jgi:protein O-mannosyl-transferase